MLSLCAEDVRIGVAYEYICVIYISMQREKGEMGKCFFGLCIVGCDWVKNLFILVFDWLDFHPCWPLGLGVIVSPSDSSDGLK